MGRLPLCIKIAQEYADFLYQQGLITSKKTKKMDTREDYWEFV
jgi:hypothetical protein